MALTEAYANAATVSTTEYSLPNNSVTLTPITAVGIFQLFLDLNALTATESYVLKLYETVNGNKRLIQAPTIVGPLGTPLYVTPALALMNGWDMTLMKLKGTDRAVAWSIRQVA